MIFNLFIENHTDFLITEELNRLWQEAACTALSEKTVLNGRSCELNLILCDNEEIKKYNLEYRNIDKETDVLSFPMIDDWSEIEDFPADIPVIIGDIIISVPKASEQAEIYGHSFEREAVFLFTHGVLHCLGYDHIEEDDELKMREKQREIMTKLDLNVLS